MKPFQILSIFLFLFAAILLSHTNADAKVVIPLVKSTPPTTDSKGDSRAPERISEMTPLAVMDSCVLNISFPAETASNVVIINDSNNIVKKLSFGLETVVALNIHSLLPGRYYLFVNAYDEWWNGGFDYFDTAPKANDNIIATFGNGQMEVRSVFATSYNTMSDTRLYENIEQVTEGCLDDIMKLNVLRYDINLQNKGTSPTLPDSSVLNTYPAASPVRQSNESRHIGLSGQDVQQVYPDIVTENSKGYLSINYIEIIPILVQSIKEMKEETDRLNNELSGMRQALLMSADRDIRGTGAVLRHNSPNPFKDNTVIDCYIPESVRQATLLIYDVNGRQADSIEIADRGEVSLSVSAKNLYAGIWFYSLVADKCVTGISKMLITE
ncbi:MAG: tail fiber domain-containing protein [Bacteroidaceae bacterium]|nr:tail fiber domain-containing protein [Bacteroidaceae bacterium]